MSRDGTLRVLANSIDGQPVGTSTSYSGIRGTAPSNGLNENPALGARRWTDLKDGYVGLFETGLFRIVPEGFGFANEIRFDARDEWRCVVGLQVEHYARPNRRAG